MTAPQLYAAALRRPRPTGNQFCFWCGAPCHVDFTVREYVPKTFSGYAEVAMPDSRYLCGGCVAATDEPDRQHRPRQKSWVIESTRARDFTGKQPDELAAICVAPPPPPFAIVLALSGKKHLIYRAAVNFTAEAAITVQLEDRRVTYRPDELRSRLALCGRLCAAWGKPALLRMPTPGRIVFAAQRYADPSDLFQWPRIWDEPLSRLAAALSPGKETCELRYPADAVGPPDSRVA